MRIIEWYLQQQQQQQQNHNQIIINKHKITTILKILCELVWPLKEFKILYLYWYQQDTWDLLYKEIFCNEWK